VNRYGKIALGILALLVFLVSRVFYESHREWQEGVRELAANQREEAIHHLARSIHWYAPGNPYVGKSILMLWSLATEAEKSDSKLALLAYDSIRGSLHSIRSFYWPYKEWILRANERIADLRAREQVREQPGLAYEAALEFHRKALLLDERPRTGWVIVVSMGFLGWISCVIGWIWKGFDSDGKMHLRSSLPWMVATVLFFLAWVIGLTRA
jgi:hypothetical protein